MSHQAELDVLKSSPHSRSFDHTLESNSYFGDAVYESPPLSDDDAMSDSTLDDPEDDFGHPLERMPRLRSADHGLNYDMETEVGALLKMATRYPTRSSSTSSADFTNYDRIVDSLIHQQPDPFDTLEEPRNMVIFDPPKDDTLYRYMEAMPPMLIRRLKRTSEELFLLLELNRPKLREDPWNVAPYIIGTVERDDNVYLCFQRLSDYNRPLLVTISHYIDLFRQILEGLSFLHEQRMAGFSCSRAISYMVDLNSQSSSTLKDASTTSTMHFDRSKFPVRYYFTDFSNAVRVPRATLFPASSPPTPAAGSSEPPPSRNAFIRDVQDCGTFIESLLLEIPPVATKFKSLTKAMIFGGFNSDDARRLFEALCRTIPTDVFEKSALPMPNLQKPERAHTISDPTTIKFHE